ncbi:MAG: sulfatase [Melioribacteraceae bacterium]|nr:sulfatase [Melioribacteraceae bacterium]
MKKIFLLILGCFIVQGVLANPASEKSDKKNILFIAVDDLKPNIGCFGDDIAITPNIDRLAEQGTVFANNHCQQAVCAPSRASLLTGLRPDRTEVWDLKTLIRDKNPDALTMPQYFRKNGYITAASGKIFDLRSVDKKHDEVSWSIPYEYPQKPRWLISKGKISVEAPDMADSNFIDGNITDQALTNLSKMNKSDKPFFLAVGYKKPHLPFVAPKKYWDLYNREDFVLHPFQAPAANAPEFARHRSGELRNYDDIPYQEKIKDEQQLELIHGYYACVSHIDNEVGRLLSALDSLDLRKNTIVVFWGDHGWHLGDHGLWCKHSNYEQATRAPLIVSTPEIKGNNISYSPTEFIDIFPTLCELTENISPNHLEGQSLVPIMNESKISVKEFAVSQFHRKGKKEKLEGYAFRDRRYRYVEWLNIEIRETGDYENVSVVARELYDYEADPLEKRNLVDDEGYENIVKEFEQKVKSFFQEFE